MDFVNFSTAIQLKKNGFPQPELAQGQTWYNRFGQAVFICYKTNYGFFYIANLDTGNGGSIDSYSVDLQNSFFAPMSTDILKELGGEYYLSCNEEGKFRLLHNKYNWSDHLRHLNMDGRPADLCAAVWIINMGIEK